MTDEGTLMKTVQKINPGQPEMPEWIYNGAILGVQGGTVKSRFSDTFGLHKNCH